MKCSVGEGAYQCRAGFALYFSLSSSGTGVKCCFARALAMTSSWSSGGGTWSQALWLHTSLSSVRNLGFTMNLMECMEVIEPLPRPEGRLFFCDILNSRSCPWGISLFTRTRFWELGSHDWSRLMDEIQGQDGWGTQSSRMKVFSSIKIDHPWPSLRTNKKQSDISPHVVSAYAYEKYVQKNDYDC